MIEIKQFNDRVRQGKTRRHPSRLLIVVAHFDGGETECVELSRRCGFITFLCKYSRTLTTHHLDDNDNICGRRTYINSYELCWPFTWICAPVRERARMRLLTATYTLLTRTHCGSYMTPVSVGRSCVVLLGKTFYVVGPRCIICQGMRI